MRFRSIKALIQIDLLQANRQLNTKDKADKLDKENIYRRILIQNVAVIGIFALLFGSILSNVPLAEFPGLFTQTMQFMVLFSLLQLFQIIYNLFFDERDLSVYLSLPFTVSELFVSKLLSVILSTFSYFMSPLILITILGTQTGYSIFPSLLIGILSGLLIMAVVILSIFVGLDLLHRFAFFNRHRRTAILLIYIVLFGYIFISLYGNNMDTTGAAYGLEVMDPKIRPLFSGFYEIFIPEFQLLGWGKVGVWGLIGLVLMFMMFKWIVPQLYSESRMLVQKPSKVEQIPIATLTNNSIWKVFLKFQLRQLQETSLILQMLFAKFYFPLVMIGPTLFDDQPIDLSVINEIPHLWGAFLLVGAGLGGLMISESTISGIIISFDKENYYYIQSLPISFRGYLKLKFYFSFLIEWLISAVVIIGLSLYLGISLLTLGFILVGFTIGTYIGSLYFYMRDYRLLDLNWNNFTELTQRGMTQGLKVVVQLATLALGALIMFGLLFWFVFVINEFTRLIISTIILITFFLSFLFMNRYAEEKFWSQFNL